MRLADRFDDVVALDLVESRVSHPKITTLRGNAAEMHFPDNCFDAVLCAGSRTRRADR